MSFNRSKNKQKYIDLMASDSDIFISNGLSNPIKTFGLNKYIMFCYSSDGLHEFILCEDSLKKLSIGRLWTARKHAKSGHLVYAVCMVKSKPVSMHRFLVGAKKGEIVDHEDRNSLNNCMCNLKIGTHFDNMQNKSAYKSNSTGIPNTIIHRGGLKFHLQRKLLNKNKEDIAELSRKINKLINEHNDKYVD